MDKTTTGIAVLTTTLLMAACAKKEVPAPPVEASPPVAETLAPPTEMPADAGAAGAEATAPLDSMGATDPMAEPSADATDAAADAIEELPDNAQSGGDRVRN